MYFGNAFKYSAFVATTVVVLASCGQNGNEVSDQNLVQNSGPSVDRIIGEGRNRFSVSGALAVGERARVGKILTASSDEGKRHLDALTSVNLGNVRNLEESAAAAADANLILGYPVGLLGEKQVFGGVITKVSDKKNDNLGRLRLSDLTPLHVRTVVGKGEGDKYFLALVGCASACGEGSKEGVVLSIPITGIDTDRGTVLVDLAVLGKGLNLVEIKDPFGSFTGLKTKSSEVTTFDFSHSTLVFDIETKMIPADAEETNPEAPVTLFTARWYLRLGSVFEPSFEPRGQTEGVGYFTTRRGKQTRITRFAKPAPGNSVKYYIKNVPKEHQAAFAASFDEWNVTFKATTGNDLLSYEFVNPGDAKYNLVVAGDIRFNVLEWDIDNLAPYGGFGPSIANQYTGEMLSANVLVQGPKIVELYSAWYKVSERADRLRERGHLLEAEQLIVNFHRQVQERETRLASGEVKLTLGDSLEFHIGAQSPQLEDPAFQRADFDETPKGFTYEQYMEGYFKDLVQHELGHNFGLRHNFRGNLSAKNEPELGGVSHSIMEYLGRTHRHLDRIGSYDKMAIAYGYAGKAPESRTMFCTDENVADPTTPDNSAECSRDDAGNDPFAYFESRLTKSTNMLVLRGSTEAPVWTVPDMERELTAAVTGLGLYATTAEATGSSWTNFFKTTGRPATADGVREYVLKQVKAVTCDASLAEVVAQKADAAAKEKTTKNIEALRVRVAELLESLEVFQPAELTCQ